MTRGPAEAPAPAVALTLDPDVRVLDGGRVLLGGDPGRLVRLSDSGARTLAGWSRGAGIDAGADGLARTLLDRGLVHPRPALDDGRTTGAVVVIPVRDRSAQLARCLAALGSDVPVVVVDDGSTDPAAVAAVCAASGARLVRRPVNGGPAAARNTGLAATSAPTVAFLDSDCLPPPGWPAALLGHFADPAVGAVAPRLVSAPGRRSLLARYAAARGPLDMGPHEAAVRPGGRVPYVPTAALVVRRAALPAGAVFDPRLRFGEDVDLVWRLVDAGWRVRYDPRVVVGHDEPDGWRTWLARRRDYGTSAAPLAARHPGRLAPLVCSPWAAGAAVLALLGRPVLAGVAAAAPAVPLYRALRRSRLPRQACARVAAAVTARGWLATVRGLGGAGAVVTLPTVAGMLLSRRTRGAAVAALVLPPLLDHARRRPAMDPARWVVLRLLDDLAYAAGVWLGSWRARSAGAVLPATRRPR